MQEMNIHRVDLNLFVVFDAIYSQGSITRAADTLNLSQPAVSHALGRLRERLGDPLFVRRGSQMVPTVRARALIHPVRESLAGLQECLTGDTGFDPARAQRTFVVGMRDGQEAVVLPDLLQQLEQHAPEVRLQSLTVNRRDMARELIAGRLDLAMDVLLPVSDEICHQHLLSDPLVVLMRREHPLAKGRLTLRRYLGARHALVSSRRQGPGIEDFGLARLGHHRDIRLRCQHYQAAIAATAKTDLLLTLPGMIASELAAQPGLIHKPVPVDLPPLEVHLYWHREQDNEPGHRWLRQLFFSQSRRDGDA